MKILEYQTKEVKESLKQKLCFDKGCQRSKEQKKGLNELIK